MTAGFDLTALVARARGLRTRLVARGVLDELADASDVQSLARGLARQGPWLEPVEQPVTWGRVEAAVRRTAARHLRVLATWARACPLLDIFYADQDRRSLRALLRGALEGASVDERLAGLLATPRLPERLLEVLARQPTAARVVAQLVLARHPDAAMLTPVATRAHPAVLEVEHALVAAFADRSVAAARSGDENLRQFVRTRVDVCNMQMALSVAGRPRDVAPDMQFTDGGAALDRRAFASACDAPSAGEASERMRRALAGTALQELASLAGGDPVRLEDVATRRALEHQRRQERLDPLGSAPLVSFLLRLQAQTMDIQRLVGGVTLGAPASVIRAALVTPWS